MNLLTKQKETHRLRKLTYGCWGWGWGEGIVRDFQKVMYTLLYLTWITNKDLLYSTWNSAHCSSLDGRGVWGRMDTCIRMAESLHCSSDTITRLFVNGLYPNTK